MMYISSLLIAGLCFLMGGYNSPERPLACQNTSGDTIRWTPGYRLRLEDFKGAKPDKLTGRAAGIDTIGLSYLSISHSITVKDGKMQIDADAIFIRSKSFILSDSLGTLKHEQAHFDIQEIYALKLEKLVNEMNFTHITPFMDFLQANYVGISNEALKKHDDFDMACKGDLTKQRFYDWIQQELDKYYKK